jgi:hypothetical protein
MKWRFFLILVRYSVIASLLPLLNCTLLFSNPPETEYFDTRSNLLAIVGLSNHLLFSTSEQQTSDEIQFSPAAGIYFEDQIVTIQGRPGSEIFFRINESLLDCESGNPLSSIPVNTTGTTIYAISCMDGDPVANASATYTLQAPVPIPNDPPGLDMSGGYKEITFPIVQGFLLTLTTGSSFPPTDPVCPLIQEQINPISIYPSPNPWYIKAISCRSGYEPSLFSGEYYLTGKLFKPTINSSLVAQNTYEVTMNANATGDDPPGLSQTICYHFNAPPSCGGDSGNDGICSVGLKYTGSLFITETTNIQAISCYPNYRQSNVETLDINI